MLYIHDYLSKSLTTKTSDFEKQRTSTPTNFVSVIPLQKSKGQNGSVWVHQFTFCQLGNDTSKPPNQMKRCRTIKNSINRTQKHDINTRGG